MKRKKARVDTPVDKLNEKETLMHYNAVMMEDMNSKLQLVLEVVRSNSERLSIVEKSIRPIPAILERLSTLEVAVRSNSERLSTFELVFRGLKDDMLDMERRICSKINRIVERCENHECRLTALEAGQ